MYGASSLRRKLKRMPDDVKGEVQEAVVDSVDTVYAEALIRVPKGKTGALMRALGKLVSSDKLGGRVGFWKSNNKRRWRLAGWRAHFTEFGTRGYAAGSTRTRSNSKTTSKISRDIPAHPAQPFLGPAFNISKQWIVTRMNKAIDSALKKVING